METRDITVNDFVSFFASSHVSDKELKDVGLYVSSSVRKHFLLHNQNTLIRKGTIVKIKWENVGSGVYLAKLN